MGFSPPLRPARASLMGVARLLIASSCPNTTICRFFSSFCNVSLSLALTDLGGMRAIFAITASMSVTPITFLRLDAGSNC